MLAAVPHDVLASKLDRIATRVVEFPDLPGAFADLLASRATGRTVVRVRNDTR
jgi:hypothetical protein